ncbi:MAG TPA: hypothetical protein DCS83_03215 [Prevotella sp.]|nr:hypothetical protein [Prevotella sp.]
MTQDDILKLKAVALYVIDKCKGIDYFHLFKIIYFADKEHYAVYGRRIIKDTFCALKNGPVPSNLYNAIKDATGKEKLNNTYLEIISNSIEANDPDYDYIITAKEKPDMDELSKSDIEMLDRSIDENLSLPFPVLSKKSHDTAWQTANAIHPTSEIDPLLMAQAAGASDATMDFIRENEELDKILNS